MGLGSVNVHGGSSGNAVDVAYNNRKSGLKSTNTQDAIDEMSEALSAAEPLSGTSDPTVSTPGAVGQHYTNTATGKEFTCIEADDETGVYKWEASNGVPLDSGSTVPFSFGYDAGGFYAIIPDAE